MSYGIYPKQIIYDSKNPVVKGEIILRASPRVRFYYGIINGIATGLIGFFIITILFYIFPIIREEALYRLNKKEIKTVNSGFGDIIKTIDAERISRTQDEAQSFGVNSYFSIVIPKIGATANIQANVSTSDENEYSEALKRGVAHAKGTYFPDQEKTIYLFAHSTNSSFNVIKYNAVFFLLNKLEKDDQIIIYFLDKKFIYKVTDKLIVSPKDTSWLSPGNEEILILQTCYPPGTTWQRLLVFARRV